MESRAFIRAANALAQKLGNVTESTGDEERGTLQKEINSTFSGLQNPTLMAAARLREAAEAKGFQINPQVVHRLTQAEAIWGQ